MTFGWNPGSGLKPDMVMAGCWFQQQEKGHYICGHNFHLMETQMESHRGTTQNPNRQSKNPWSKAPAIGWKWLKPAHQKGPSPPPERTEMEQTCALNDEDRDRNVLREGGVRAEDGPWGTDNRLLQPTKRGIQPTITELVCTYIYIHISRYIHV